MATTAAKLFSFDHVSFFLCSSVNMVIYCLWNAQFRKTAKNVALYLYICVRRGDRAAALRLELRRRRGKSLRTTFR